MNKKINLETRIKLKRMLAKHIGNDIKEWLPNIIKNFISILDENEDKIEIKTFFFSINGGNIHFFINDNIEIEMKVSL